MAPSSLSQANHSDQPRNSFSYNSRCGSSKAQLCLQKILHIILTIPSETIPIPNQPSSQNDSKDIPPRKMEDPPISPATASADQGLAVNVEVVKEGTDDDDKKGGEDYMGLLIDAAKLIFGETKEDDQKKQSFDDFNDEAKVSEIEKQRVNNKRRNQRWKLDLYEEGIKEPEQAPVPVVRTKRGRTQVLPCKYRDSVLEPLTRVSRNRSSIISNKRRLM